MSKYIDAEKLKVEVERRKEKWLAASRLIKKGKDKAMYAAGKSSAYTEFFSLITSLQQEQPEVDINKEIEKWFDLMGDAWENGEWSTNDIRSTARHFYELGLNARKED